MLIGDEFAYTVMADIAEISDKLNDLYFENDGQYEIILTAQLLFLAQKYNLKPQKQFRDIDYVAKSNKGIADLVWYGQYKIIAAFEIGNNFLNKPVKRLNSIDAVHKFWIYYGKDEIPEKQKIINEYKIHIIILNKNGLMYEKHD